MSWGINNFGQLGNGNFIDQFSPVQVVGLNNVIQIASSHEYTLALLSNGQIRGWGVNVSGSLGIGNTIVLAYNTPQAVINITNAKHISVGADFSLALLNNGNVMSWGVNFNGQLGNGNTNNTGTPQQVIAITANIVDVEAHGESVLAKDVNGNLWGWGYNNSEQVECNGSLYYDTPIITQVVTGGVLDIVNVPLYNYSLVISNNSDALTWGWNDYGQLGQCSTIDNCIPTPAMTPDSNIDPLDEETDCFVFIPDSMPNFEYSLEIVQDTTICLGDTVCLYAIAKPDFGTYLWSTGDTTDTICVAPTTTTQYTLQYTQCDSTLFDTITVVVSDIQPLLTQITLACENNCNGSISLQVTGGVPPYTYQWDANAGNATTQSVSGLCTGTYQVTVSDAVPCSAIFVFDVDTAPSPPNAIVQGPEFGCDTGTFTITNFDSTLTYTWDITTNFGSVLSGGGANDSATTIAMSGNAACFLLTSTNSFGCSVTDTICVKFCCWDGFSKKIVNESVSTFPYPNPYNGISEGPLYINGTFTIDARFEFVDATVLIGPNARIEIPAAQADTLLLSVANAITVLEAGCDTMWDGIYVYGTQNAVISGGTGAQPIIIRDADSAIASFNGGDFAVTGTLFENNYKGIVVAPFPSSQHPGDIIGNTFRTDVNNIGLLAPRLGQRAHLGVQANNVGLLTVGTDTIINGGNTFSNMDYGVNASLTNIRIWNNTFEDIDGGFPFQTIPIGVGVKVGGIQFFGTVSAQIGGLGSRQNTFTNCSYGAWAQSNINVSIANNIFTNTVHVGTYLFNLNSGNTAIVRSNMYDEFTLGTWARAVPQADVQIFNNSYTRSGSLFQPFFLPQAIVAENVFATPTKLLIRNNQISANQLRVGIRVRNVYAYLTRLNIITYPNLTNAAIQNDGYSRTGILVENGAFGVTERNRVLRITGNNPIPQLSGLLTGIRTEQSFIAEVNKNTALSMHTGIYAKGTMNGSQLFCNNLIRDWVGFRFDNAVTGDQGCHTCNPIVAQDNRWIANVNNVRSDGNLGAPTDWTYRIGGIFNVNPADTLLIQSGYQDQGPFFNVPNNCGFGTDKQVPPPPLTPSPMLRTSLFADIVFNSVTFGSLEQEHRFNSTRDAYQEFYTNQGWLMLDPNTDSLYQHWYDSVSLTNIGQMQVVEDLIAQGNCNAAGTVCNTIMPTNQQETNLVDVYNIYIATWGMDTFVFDMAQQAILESIACQDPLLGGGGVYMARVLLGEALPCSNYMKTAPIKDDVDTKHKNSERELLEAKLYPNPNNGNMVLEYVMEGDENGELDIIGIDGRAVYKRILQPGYQTINISIAEIPSGVYYYRINQQSKLLKTDKIVIIK